MTYAGAGAGLSFSYTYDVDGTRNIKRVGDVSHTYIWEDGKPLQEWVSGNTDVHTAGTIMYFYYDMNGRPYGLQYNGNIYYYLLNAQGDVIRMLDSAGNTVASYEYDPFGNILSATGTMAEANPLRYRGYYYDRDTGFYYLNSRYYDPKIGRFINADSYVSTGQGIVGYNMFAYCLNNPVNGADYEGREAISIASLLFCAVIIVGVTSYCSYLARSSMVQADWSQLYWSMGNTLTNRMSNLEEAVQWTTVSMLSRETLIQQSIMASFANATTVSKYKSQREIHHLVAKRARNASYARSILEQVGIGYNSEYNLVPIKTGLHRRLHTDLYYGWANSVVISAYNSANGNKEKQYINVMNALGVIRGFVLSLDAVSPY